MSHMMVNMFLQESSSDGNMPKYFCMKYHISELLEILLMWSCTTHVIKKVSLIFLNKIKGYMIQQQDSIL